MNHWNQLLKEKIHKWKDIFDMSGSSYFRSVFRRFLTTKEWRTMWILRGCSKPLYEAPNLNCNQIGQSGHQIEDNFISKSNLVSIQFNFQWKVIYQKAFWRILGDDRTVLPDSLEITFFGTKSIQKAMAFFPDIR